MQAVEANVRTPTSDAKSRTPATAHTASMRAGDSPTASQVADPTVPCGYPPAIHESESGWEIVQSTSVDKVRVFGLTPHATVVDVEELELLRG